MVQLAEDGLSDPVDTDLLELSLCDPEDDACISRAKLTLYQKARLEEMDKTSALNTYAKYICDEILENALDPLVGSQMIAKVAISADVDGYDNLDPFIYIYSEVGGRPSDKDFFANAARREAELFLSRER